MVMRWLAFLRSLFAVVFIAGGISHIVLGRVSPEGYAAYGDTAWPDALAVLWHEFVMPNIGWLTLVLAVFEIAVGVGLLLRGRAVQLAAIGALGFLVFILVLGYSFPAADAGESFLKNRLFTLVMMAMVAPLAFRGSHPGIISAWRRWKPRRM